MVAKEEGGGSVDGDMILSSQEAKSLAAEHDQHAASVYGDITSVITAKSSRLEATDPQLLCFL